MTANRILGAVLFEDFELLDLYGPLEMFGNLGPELEIATIAEQEGAIRSAQGPSTVAQYDYMSAPALDFLLLPGGFGTFAQAENVATLDYLRANKDAEVLMSVCSGSGVLARAGLLDGRRATSNKLFFEAITAGSDKVEWQEQARWVEDGNIFTSSGVSAGTDMSLGVIAKVYGNKRAEEIAVMTEYAWQKDASHDDFSAFINQGNMEDYLRVLGKA